MDISANKNHLSINGEKVAVDYAKSKSGSILITPQSGEFPKGFNDAFNVKDNSIAVHSKHRLFGTLKGVFNG